MAAKATYESIQADLRKGELAPVYLLCGEEAYYIDSLCDYFQNQLLDEAAREFDLTVIYGKEVDNMARVVETARRYPMMGARQVVILKEAQSVNAKLWADLTPYMAKPQPQTVLVICYKYGHPDLRKKPFSDIGRAGVIYESKKLYENQVAPWIMSYVKGRHYAIDINTATLLGEYLGNDLQKIANEVDKLFVGLPDGKKTITAELIERNIGISKDYNVFELQKALTRGDVVQCNRIINYFADNEKQNPAPPVLSQLFKFFSDLMIYHYLGDKSERNVAEVLKINTFFVRDYQAAAYRFKPMRTMNAISWIREADARCKGVDDARGDYRGIMQELIFKLLH